MTTNTAGLSIQAAFQEAIDEDGAPAPTSEESGDSSIIAPEGADAEQSAVESDEEKDDGLFSSLQVEQPEGEQPQDVDSLTVDVDGRQMTVAELRSEHMMQADYTQKTQELSEQRAEADKALVLYQALQDNPMQTVQKLWDGVNKGQTLEPLATPTAPNTDIDALVEAKLNERLASDPRLVALDEQRAITEVNAVFGQIEETYGVELNDADKVFVMEKAQEAGTSDLALVFGGLMQKKALQDKQRDNAVENSTSLGYGGRLSEGSPPPEDKKFGSWREAMQDTLREENIEGDQLNAIVANL
jgi:hypothetical protein